MHSLLKEYGKLTPEQFRRLISRLPEIRSADKELSKLIKETPPSKVCEILGKDFSWAVFYELSMAEHTALLFAALGQVHVISYALQCPDPQEVILKWMSSEEVLHWNGGENGAFKKEHVFALTISLMKTLLSVMIYGRSLSALVQEVREGNDESFFAAVRVDRTIVACPTFAARISRAELSKDKAFFIHLRNAMKGLSGKHWARYYDLRYALAILREMGLDNLTDVQLEELLVKKLRVYPDTYNARKNLRAQYAASRKLSSI